MGKSANLNDTASNPIMQKVTQDPRNVMARDQLDDWDDPYIPDGHYPDGTVCKGCGAIYQNQHWAWDDQKRDLLRNSGAANEVLCPGCRIASSRDPQGIVTLKGDYWPQHREDIINLIHNEERRGAEVNPLERIIQIREEGDALIIETTTEKMGQRIGRAIHKAHKGDIQYNWSGEGNHLVRVNWERSLG